MQTFSYVIKDELGIHARPAGMLVKEVKNFSSTVTISCGEKSAALKGVLGIMGMAVKKGDQVTVTVEGADEKAAADALKTFFEKNL